MTKNNMTPQVTDATFEQEVVKSKVPVMVDFWAPWCGPCRITGPLVDELATEIKPSSIKIVKINVDDNQKTAESFGIMSIPTFLFFKHGKVVDQMVGAQPKETFKKKIQELL